MELEEKVMVFKKLLIILLVISVIFVYGFGNNIDDNYEIIIVENELNNYGMSESELLALTRELYLDSESKRKSEKVTTILTTGVIAVGIGFFIGFLVKSFIPPSEIDYIIEGDKVIEIK